MLPRGEEKDRNFRVVQDCGGFNALLKTVRSAFANKVGDSIMGVKKKEVRNRLDDILIPNRTFDEQLKLVRETFDYLRQSKLSVNLPKSKFYFSVVKWLGMIKDRFGIGPALSKIETTTQLSQP